MICPRQLVAEPETFAVYDEGDGLRALYLTPAAPAALAAALRSLRLKVRDVSPEDGDSVELLHVPETDDAATEEYVLMADPHRALSAGRRVAVSIADDGHGVVYSRDADVLEAVLDRWLGRDDTEQTPAGPSALAPLLEPLKAGQWWEPERRDRRRFETVDFHNLTKRRRPAGPPVRWVGGGGRAWRAGWRF